MINTGYSPKNESINLNVSNFLKELDSNKVSVYDEDEDNEFSTTGDELISTFKKKGYIKDSTDLKEIIRTSKKEYQVVTRNKALLDTTIMNESLMNESTDLKKKDIRSLVKSMKPGQIITILGGIKNWNYRYIKLDDNKFGILNIDEKLTDNNGLANSGRYAILGETEVIENADYHSKKNKADISIASKRLDPDTLIKICLKHTHV